MFKLNNQVIFDKKNQNWAKDLGFNIAHLLAVQEMVNHTLRATGIVSLNEVYDAIGVSRLMDAVPFGWVYNDEMKDTIDFGIPNDLSGDSIVLTLNFHSLCDINKIKKEDKKMKVLRTVEVRTEQYVVGDQINLKVKGFDKKYTATCHKVVNGKAFFLLDEYITTRSMNECGSNTGGFEQSDLNRWLQEVLLPAFPKKIRKRLVDGLTIPSYGMFFGHDEDYQIYFEEDNDEQLPLMKIRKNRIAHYKDVPEWGWLRNKRKNTASHFANVIDNGNANAADASGAYGVLVGFWLQMVGE